MTDLDIRTEATGPNQRLWELGDVFEIFLQPEGGRGYLELHVAPNNCRLQLRFADVASEDYAYTRHSGDLSRVLLPDGVFDSWTWVDPPANLWAALASIPSSLVDREPGPVSGRVWRYSFSRYDYTHGEAEPVISSTSKHTVADFHRREEWGWLRFDEPARDDA